MNASNRYPGTSQPTEAQVFEEQVAQAGSLEMEKLAQP